VTSVSASSAVFLGSAIVLGGAEIRTTLVRTRGAFLGFLSSATAINDGVSGAFGIGIASAAAVAAGAASVPTPITESDSDNWIYHRFFHLRSPGAIDTTARENTVMGSAWERFEVDSKAMRIVDAEQSIYSMVEVVVNATATAQFFFDSRMLIKLT